MGRRIVRFTVFGLVLLIGFSSGHLTAQRPRPEGPLTLAWRYAAGGAIDAFPAQGPGGNLYIIADDRALHAIDPSTGRRRWIYRPGGRLGNLLMAAPDGTVYVDNERNELFAVTPGGTGRWKLRMRRPAAALPAASPNGAVVLPLTGGRILGISRKGAIIWSRDESAEASGEPVISADATAWIPLTDGRLLGIGPTGETRFNLDPGTAISSLALDGAGRLLAGSLSGRLLAIDIATGAVTGDIRLGDDRVVSLITYPGGPVTVFLADGTTATVDGSLRITDTRRGAAAGGAPSADTLGTLYIPAADGTIRVVRPDGTADTVAGPAALAEPLLTEGGLLVAGGGDWILYAWEAGAPGPGWRQFRGGASRAGAFPAERTPPDRAEARNEAGFYGRERIARLGEAADRLDLVRELGSYPDDASLRRAMPWAPLLLEDLAAGGTLREIGGTDLPYDGAAVVRAEAYALLARGEDFRDRDFIIDCLRQETDPHALSVGFLALGEIGSDWDGASTRVIVSRYHALAPSGGDPLALAAARALEALVRYNGIMPDPSGFALMNHLVSGSLSAAAREELIVIYRRMSGL